MINNSYLTRLRWFDPDIMTDPPPNSLALVWRQPIAPDIAPPSYGGGPPRGNGINISNT